jgi:hypothetical protein
MTRYADDWVITCKSAEEAHAALTAAARVLEELGVQMNSQKTRVVLAMDAWSTPQRIVATHHPDQITNLLAAGRDARAARAGFSKSKRDGSPYDARPPPSLALQ